MKKEKLFKYLSFGLFAAITAILMAATIAEKLYGTEYALENIYCAGWMIALWTVSAVSAIVYMLQRRLHKQPVTLCLHLSFAVILAGALVTHLTGKQGQMHLREGELASSFTLADGTVEKFPFAISLKEFKVIQYAGTQAPMDFKSLIVVHDNGETEGSVSMNNIFKYKGYRFYQSGYDKDRKGTFFAVSHDPWGIGITYAGYSLLLLSMILFFFYPGSMFRATMRSIMRRKACLLLPLILFPAVPAAAETAPRTLPRESAEKFCNIHVCYNNRICPLQTLAIDFTAKMCGKRSYRGYTAEQVLAGWLFFYDDWKSEPMIKIKGKEVRNALGIEGDYAKLTDFIGSDGYKLEEAMRGKAPQEQKNYAAAIEKFNIASMVYTGTMLKIFPYTDIITGETAWFSFAERLPENIPPAQALFIAKSMNLAAEKIVMNDYEGAIEIIGKIREYQKKEGGESIPSEQEFNAEKFYNSINGNRPLAMACLTAGILSFLIFCIKSNEGNALKAVRIALKALAWCIMAYLALQIALRWYISGHIPLSNGHETMIFMALCSTLPALSAGKGARLSIPFGYIICGFSLLVATMSEATPQITPLMPVLQSPLLCIHVVVIMISYTILAFTMLNGIAAFIMHFTRKDSVRETVVLQERSRAMLYPAVFLLTAGIFIGAVWANVSWGRYWGWDPKEVWALITMLVYSAALHSGSIKIMRRPLFFHAYCIAAFLTVLITYFGVNFILGGMHSYA